MSKFYVYLHRHPITKEPFYVGSGTGQRAYERKGRSERWLDIVSKLKKDGLAHSIEIVHICDTKEVSLELEKIEIAKYENLTNIRDNYKQLEVTDIPSFEKDLKYLGDIINKERINQDIRACDLAKSVKISRITLSKIEQGKGLKCELGIILKILDKLNIHARLPL